MNARRWLAIARLAFAIAIASAIAVLPPALPRIYASLARMRVEQARDSVGWFGAYAIDRIYAGPFHYGGLVFASCIVATIAFLAVEARARTNVDRIWSFVAALLAATCCLDALRVGGGMTDAAFAAVLILLLERRSMRASLAAVAVTVAWCNFDATGLVAPAFAFVYALGTNLDRIVKNVGPNASDGDRDAANDVRSAWFVTVAIAFATLATPLSTAFSAHAFASLQLDGASDAYAAWTPTDLAPHAYRIGLIGIAFLALAVGMRGVSMRDGIFATTTFVLALANGAFVPIFGIVAAPIVVRALARNFKASTTPGRDRHAATVGVVALVAIASSMLAGAKALPARADEPYAAIERLARLGATHRVFCVKLAWCDAAEAGGLRVVADGRIAERPQATRDAQIAILSMKGWRESMRASSVDVAVVAADSALATLLTQAKWTSFARAQNVVVLVAGRSAR